MPNPFTNFINRSDPGSDLTRFIAAWDDLEALLIEVYRAGAAEQQDERTWLELKSTLLSLYPSVRDRLAPFVPAKDPEAGDPILAVLDLPTARDMIGNLPLLKRLPDVREAINRALLTD